MNSEERLVSWMEEYEKLVFSLCYRMTQDYFAAQDITQETFLSAFRHASDFDGSNAEAWICRIASNKCVDFLRNAGRRQIPTEDEKIPEPVSQIGRPEEETLEKELRQQLLDACRSLSPPYDTVAEDYFYLEKKGGDHCRGTGAKHKDYSDQDLSSKEHASGNLSEEKLR